MSSSDSTGSASTTASNHLLSRASLLRRSALVGAAGLGAASLSAVSAAAAGQSVDPQPNPGLDAGISGVRNIRTFGARGDGRTDDTAAVQRAFDRASRGDAVIFPPGTYVLRAPIRVSGKSLLVAGLGVGVSRLVIRHGGDGLVFDLPRVDGDPQTLTVRDLSLLTDRAGKGTALRATWGDRPSSTYLHGRFQDLEIRGLDIAKNYWARGIVLTEAWNSVISGVNVQGPANQALLYASAPAAVELVGQCIDTVVTALHAYFVDTAVVIHAGCEGVSIDHGTFVAVNHGVVSPAPDDTTAGQPLLVVRDSHIASIGDGIQATGLNDMLLSGNLLYKRPDQTLPDTAMIRLKSCSQVRITDNEMFNLDGKVDSDEFTLRAMDIADCDRVSIVGNQVINTIDQGIMVRGSRLCQVRGNHVSNARTGFGLDAKTRWTVFEGNVFEVNNPAFLPDTTALDDASTDGRVEPPLSAIYQA